MTLYILRHAIAVDRGTPGFPNDDRPLTKEGRKKMIANAAAFNELGIEVDEIISSPLIRARDTAEIARDAIGLKRAVEISDLLLPGAKPEALIDALKGRDDRVMVVGHEPHLGLLAGRLLGAAAGSVLFKKGGLCRIDLSGATALLVWLLSPKQLRAIGGNA